MKVQRKGSQLSSVERRQPEKKKEERRRGGERTCDGRVGFDRMKKPHDLSSWVVPNAGQSVSSGNYDVSYQTSDQCES